MYLPGQNTNEFQVPNSRDVDVIEWSVLSVASLAQ